MHNVFLDNVRISISFSLFNKPVERVLNAIKKSLNGAALGRLVQIHEKFCAIAALEYVATLLRSAHVRLAKGGVFRVKQ
jgi:hypothetical protein